MTGISESKFKCKKISNNNSVLRALCFRCKKNCGDSLEKIAKDFGLKSHSTVFSSIKMLENNWNHPAIKNAMSIHKCYSAKPEVVEVKKEPEPEVLEEKLFTVNPLSREFEEILRHIRNREIRNSPQRFTAVYHKAKFADYE